MPYKLPIETIAVTNAGSSINIDVTQYVDLYVISPATTGLLTGNTSIGPTGTDSIGSQYNFYIKGGITLGAFAVTVFGYSLTANQASKGCFFRAYYNGTTYDVQLFVDHSQLGVVESDRLAGNIPLSKLAADARLTTDSTVIPTTGNTYSLNTASAARYQIYTGTGTLTGSVTIGTTGTPDDGYTIFIDYRATFDVDTFAVSILGAVLRPEAALSGGIIAMGVWDATAGAFEVRLLVDSAASGIIASDNVFSLNGAKLQAGTVPKSAMAAGSTTDLYDESVNANVANTVTGDNSFAIGEGNTVNAANALALGEDNVASAQNATAIGKTNISSGPTSVAIGNENDATGSFSIAIGNLNSSSGQGSFAGGNTNTASGNSSVSMGGQNTASGNGSVALGGSNTSSGGTAVALGQQNTASAQYSMGSGFRAIAARYGEFARSSGRHDINQPTQYAQTCIIDSYRSTSDATPSLLFLDGGSLNISVADNSIVNFKGILTAVQQSGSAGTVGDTSSWQFDGAIKNVGGTVALTTGGVWFNAINKRLQKQTGTATSGAASTITLAVGSSAINDYYNLGYIYIVSGTGAGQLRQVLSYVGSTRVATMTSSWGTHPDSSSVYRFVTQLNYETDTLPWEVEVTANNSTNALDVTVTGEINKTIYWHLSLICDEIKFA